ncbi:MAG: hypothetical protein RSB69_10420 [Odoribacter sp.]
MNRKDQNDPSGGETSEGNVAAVDWEWKFDSSGSDYTLQYDSY